MASSEIQLNPKEKFPLMWINREWDDVQYYPQAKVYALLDDELLETVNLDQDGSDANKYKKDWYAPHDPSEQGRHIYIILKVYTDSGHTTHANFKDESEHFLIFQRNNKSFGGSRVEIDYEKIKKIVKNEIDKPKLDELKQLKKDLNDVIKTFSKTKKAEESEVIKGMATLRAMLSSKMDSITDDLVDLVKGKTDKKDMMLLVKVIEQTQKAINNIPNNIERVQIVTSQPLRKPTTRKFNL